MYRIYWLILLLFIGGVIVVVDVVIDVVVDVVELVVVDEHSSNIGSFGPIILSQL